MLVATYVRRVSLRAMQRNTVSDRVRERRIAAGLSPTEAAERAGVDRATVYRIESGVMPRMRTLRKLAKALDTSVEYLFVGAGDDTR